MIESRAFNLLAAVILTGMANAITYGSTAYCIVLILAAINLVIYLEQFSYSGSCEP